MKRRAEEAEETSSDDSSQGSKKKFEEISDLAKKVTQLLPKLTENVKALKREKDFLRRCVHYITMDNKSLRSSLNRTKEKAEKGEEQLREREKESDLLRAALKRMRDEFEALRRRDVHKKEEMLREKQSLRTEDESLGKENQSLRKENESLEKKVASASDKIFSLENQVEQKKALDWEAFEDLLKDDLNASENQAKEEKCEGSEPCLSLEYQGRGEKKEEDEEQQQPLPLEDKSCSFFSAPSSDLSVEVAESILPPDEGPGSGSAPNSAPYISYSWEDFDAALALHLLMEPMKESQEAH